MKKNWIKLLSLVLSIVMVLSLFAACNFEGKGKGKGDGKDSDDQSAQNATTVPKISIAGRWVGQMDMTAYFNEAMKALVKEDLVEAMTVEEIVFPVYFEADEAGNFSFHPDQQATHLALVDLKADLLEGAYAYVEAQVAGTGVTAQQLLTAQNADLEAMLDAAIDLEALLYINGMDYSGIYKLEDGKLYLANKGQDFSSQNYALCQVEGSTITLDFDIDFGDNNDMVGMVFPITFTLR